MMALRSSRLLLRTQGARGLAAAATAANGSGEEPAKKVKTGILMLNMGGPSKPEETGPFLNRLFRDTDIIDLGGGQMQEVFGTVVARMRTPKVEKQYEEIGGSPIRKWTEYQGKRMAAILDEIRPESAPHKAYTAFRYASPLTDVALEEMKRDGVEHAIAFSQFPQWSCTTSGSSMNELWRETRRLGLQDNFRWSIIDRWPLHEGFLEAVTERITERLLEFNEKTRKNVVIVFSAHSVPMKVVEKGDHYVNEIAASVKAVMERLDTKVVGEGKIPGLRTVNKHVLAWQSKVGFLPWMVPSTESVLKNLGKRGHKSVLVVPVAFTSDHIETLFEIGMEYAEDAEKAGIADFRFTEGLNGSETFCNALADVVKNHLDAKQNYSPQYKMKCLTCQKPLCRQIMNPAF
ncbi:Ferrochelatase, mitochondrial [Hondaea fermentalgiana]|uniref:Ferrochelatase n=1 Tax=Hondaea fermentalgiana TaxID=2315210 RepID=A0A2R5GTZ1_9STRA|nr:Ferrochelatase, mitochondrial [Hondaea fermentalgiana]|eukprot:GBG34332.1 Ferrochelatase, mitochondrial [Hondaea fermentalgiana]